MTLSSRPHFINGTTSSTEFLRAPCLAIPSRDTLSKVEPLICAKAGLRRWTASYHDMFGRPSCLLPAAECRLLWGTDHRAASTTRVHLA